MQQTREQYSLVFTSRLPTQCTMPTVFGLRPSRRTHVAAGRSGSVHQPFHFQRRVDVRVGPVPVVGGSLGVEDLETGGHDHAADLDGVEGLGLREVEMAWRSAQASTQVFLHLPVLNSMQESGSMTTSCGTACGKGM